METLTPEMTGRVTKAIVFAKSDSERALGLCALHLYAVRASYGLAELPPEVYGFAMTRWPVQMDAIPDNARPSSRAAVVAGLALLDMDSITSRDLRAAYTVVRFLDDVATREEEIQRKHSDHTT